MNWIVASALMAISSVVLYLAARKSSLIKNSVQYNNLSMFLIPIFLYSAIANRTGADMSITPYQLLIVILMGIFFSWLGNIASMMSIEYAPNPGYSLVLSKSYVVFTTIVAVFIFNAQLNLQTILAILTIILGSALVSVGKSSNVNVNPKWLPLSILAFFCWGMLSLTSKYLLNIGLGIYPRLIYNMIVVSVLIIVEIWRFKKFVIPSKLQLILLILIGIGSASFNYFMQVAFASAPNIGYVNAINAGSISVVTLGSAILFKDELTIRKLIGVIVASIGLVALVI